MHVHQGPTQNSRPLKPPNCVFQVLLEAINNYTREATNAINVNMYKLKVCHVTVE